MLFAQRRVEVWKYDNPSALLYMREGGREQVGAVPGVNQQERAGRRSPGPTGSEKVLLSADAFDTRGPHREAVELQHPGQE